MLTDIKNRRLIIYQILKLKRKQYKSNTNNLFEITKFALYVYYNCIIFRMNIYGLCYATIALNVVLEAKIITNKPYGGEN